MKTFKNKDFISIGTPYGSDDFKLFQSIVNIGIDSHLEGFTQSQFFFDCGKYYFHFHKSEKSILLRRLNEYRLNAAIESDFDTVNQWIDDITDYDKIITVLK